MKSNTDKASSASTSADIATGTGLRQRKSSKSDPADSSTSNPDASQASLSTASQSQQLLDDPSGKTRPRRQLTISFDLKDFLLAALLFIFAACVRFYRLASLQAVVFDEVHYLNFDIFILSRQYFFDVNPVFGKLVIAYVAHLIGFDPSVDKYESLSQPIHTHLQAFSARAPAALFGSLTVPVFYRVCRLLRLSRHASVMGAMFILLDSMHIIQSRITMVDSVLVFFTCLALLFGLLLWDAKNVVVIKRASVQMPDVIRVLVYLVLTGICCGLCVSVRWTAFATPVLIFTISFFGIPPFCREPLNFIELVVLYGSAVAAYIGSFAIFLIKVNMTGPGDGFMSPEFQACLEGSKFWTGPAGCELSLWARIVEVNKTIFHYSKGIRGKDKWGSSWFQWIFNWRGALYHRQAEPGTSKLSLIYVMMNPVMVVCIDSLMGVFVAALFSTVRYRKSMSTTEAFKQHLRRGSALFFGWVCSMLPTMVVYRSGPVYQYLPGLFFAQALGAVGFDLIPNRLRLLMAVVLAGGMMGALAYWAPWVYATPLEQNAHIQRRWLPRWD